MTLLSIVIPVHNQSGYTRSCLASLRQYPPSIPFEVIVVDDGSTDDTAQVVASFTEALPVRLVANQPPHRFARACNRGAAEAGGELLLLLNNDTELLPGWFEPLYRVLTAHQEIGIVVPKLLFPDGTVQHCGKVWAEVATADAQPYHLYYRFPANHPAVQKSRFFQTVTGACLLVRTGEFRSLGGFDERYENGWEDDDLCAAYRAAGKQIYYCAASSSIHHQNKTLNERLAELEARLPERDRLEVLDQLLASGKASVDDLVLARSVKDIFDAMEQELFSCREKFRQNRGLFLSKWSNVITADLLIYTQADGIAPGEALGVQISPEMCRYLQHERGNVPMVSIIILTWNRLDVTRACLESIQRHTPQPHEIIVVDNGSTDDTVAWLQARQQQQPTVRLLLNTSNRGFAAGCNQGMQAATGEYLLLLNNDTVVTPGWLGGLLECLADPRVGIAGPVTNNLSGIQQWPWCNYRSIDELDQFAAAHREQYRYCRVPSRRVVGFCMLFRRSLVDQIGMLDERFGSGNFEDDDFCLRAALAGYHNVLAADVFIHHVGSASFDANRIDYRAAMLRNHALFQEKWSRPVVNPDDAARIICLKTLEKADQLCRSGQFNQAVELLLQEGIGQLPEEARLYQALAEIFLEAGMPKDALDVLREAPADSGRTQLLLSEALLGTGAIAAAAGALEQAVDADPGDVARVRGDLLAQLKNFQEATEAYLRAIELQPANAAAYSGLADIAEQCNDSASVQRLRRQAALCAGWKQNLLETYHQTLQSDEQRADGVQIFKVLRHLFPDVTVIASLLTDLLLHLRRDREAQEVIEGMFRPGVTQPEAFYQAALPVRQRLGPLQIEVGRKQQGVSVSLCMIAKDEEGCLAACLQSAKPLVDEIILVDTGSSDRTRELAGLFGAQVLEVPWQGDYAAARNSALSAAQGDWILSLDADEVISPLDYELFRQLVAEAAGTRVAFTVTTRNYTTRLDPENWQANRGEYPNEEAGRGWMPSDKVRLFPNLSQIRFENPIHEMVEPSLERCGIPCRETDFVVHHYGYLDDRRQQRKKEYYYQLGKKKYEESGGAPHALVELAIQAAGTGRYDEAIGLWQQALGIDPQSYLAWFNLGHAYLQKGLFAEGSVAGRRAMALRDNYREALINTAICDMAQGNSTAARALVDASLPINPDYPTLPLLGAVLAAVQGEEVVALTKFGQLRDARIEFQGFIHEITLKLLQGGQHVAAQRLVDTAATGGFCTLETVELLQRHTGG